MNLSEEESIIISHLLDAIGYGHTMISRRQEIISNLSRLVSTDDHYYLICGSKGEGISKCMEGDSDSITSITSDFICTEYNMIRNFSNSETKVVFYMDTEQSNPGYTLLRLAFNSQIGITRLVDENLVTMPSGIYLTSEGWKLSITEGCTKLLNEGRVMGRVRRIENWSGPSIPSVHPIYGVPSDHVYGIDCECPSLMEAWLNRSRSYSWPSPDLIRAVSETRAHVVPVGNKGSPYQLLEWRICFTEAELMLIQHLKPCYTKALILLKAVTKRTLKPICNEITSYVVKNIVLWIAENDQCETAPDTRLIAIFQEALKFLKSCIWKNNLPSYMIEQRNLFAGRLTRRSRLCARIDFLLKEGPRAVLRCGTIKYYLEKLVHSPAVLRQKLVRNREMELEHMKETQQIIEFFSGVNDSNIYKQYVSLDWIKYWMRQQSGFAFLQSFFTDEGETLTELLIDMIPHSLSNYRTLYPCYFGL